MRRAASMARSSVSAATAATSSPWNITWLPGSFHASAALTPGAFCASDKIDGHDARVRVRRPQDLAVDHARAIDVEGVLGAPGHLVGAVEPFDRRADDGRLLRPGVLVRLGRFGRGLRYGNLRALVVRHEAPPCLSLPLP